MAEEMIFQPMPPLSEDQLAALREDIEKHGVLVPITVDQYGRVLDGHNRSAIALELGIDYPKVVVEVADDDAAMDLAVTLNGARRHLNQEQKRALIEHELIRRPSDSDRAISRRVGCSPTTVGTLRAERRAAAEDSVARTHEAIHQCYRHLFQACHELMLLGVAPALLIERATLGRDACGRRSLDAASDSYEQGVALISHNIYTALVNDLNDLVAELESSGVTLPLPARLPPIQLGALSAQIYPLLTEGVQIGQPEAQKAARSCSRSPSSSVTRC